MSKSPALAVAVISLFLANAITAQESDNDRLIRQVKDTERAFATTMADRDFDTFMSFLSDEAIFFAGDRPLNGKRQVADAWKPFFQDPDAPFSWEPKTVAVLDSGGLALSSGPVFDPGGKQVATFNSIWRLDEDGEWRIIFDKGSDFCDSADVPAPASDE